MATGVLTRQRKHILSQSQPKTQLINTSYSIITSDNTSENDSKLTEAEIIVDLRDRLAKLEFEKGELQERNMELVNKLAFYMNKSNGQSYYNDNPTFNTPSSNKCLENVNNEVSTQTDVIITKSVSVAANINDSDEMYGEKFRYVRSNTCGSIVHYNRIGHLSDGMTHRILIISDSHGRGYSKRLRNALPDNFRILAFIKPNGTIDNVVENINAKVKDFGNADFVFVLAGTNDVGRCVDSSSISDLVCKFETIMEATRHTNTVISTIPFRYDKTYFNNVIAHINNRIYTKARNYNNVAMFTLNNLLNRENYTDQGLHLNSMGKKIVCDYLEGYFVDWNWRENLINHVNVSPVASTFRGDRDGLTQVEHVSVQDCEGQKNGLTMSGMSGKGQKSMDEDELMVNSNKSLCDSIDNSNTFLKFNNVKYINVNSLSNSQNAHSSCNETTVVVSNSNKSVPNYDNTLNGSKFINWNNLITINPVQNFHLIPIENVRI